MATEKIGGISRMMFNSVEAVKLYTTTNRCVTNTNGENPFNQTVSGLGLFQTPADGTGQPNGGTKPEYFADGSVYGPRTFFWA